MNIDEFGRYKGGLPNITGNRRGRSKNVPGTMHQAVQVEEELDRYPEFNVITQEKAESFKNFHQDEREARTLKWPWFSSQVDYDFFTLRNFRKKVWPKLQLIVLLFYIIPSLYYTFKTLQKRQLQACIFFITQNLRQKYKRRHQLKRPNRANLPVSRIEEMIKIFS